MRWSVWSLLLIALCGIGGLAYWLYQRPIAEAEASQATLAAEAQSLREALPTLERFGASLTTDEAANSAELFEIDEAARALFNASGNLAGSGSDLRSSAATASTSALDAVRLAGDATSYRAAVTPILLAPDLETDPNLIELDQAARDFGEWQLRFDEVRTALPEQTMTATTGELDILSGDLVGILGRYMDALREDDQNAALGVVDDLADRLASIRELMVASLQDIQVRVTERVAEAKTALSVVLGD